MGPAYKRAKVRTPIKGPDRIKLNDQLSSRLARVCGTGPGVHLECHRSFIRPQNCTGTCTTVCVSSETMRTGCDRCAHPVKLGISPDARSSLMPGRISIIRLQQPS